MSGSEKVQNHGDTTIWMVPICILMYLLNFNVNNDIHSRGKFIDSYLVTKILVISDEQSRILVFFKVF